MNTTEYVTTEVMEKDNIVGDDIDSYLHDTAEEIQKCLNCKKRECDNCLGVAYKGVR